MNIKEILNKLNVLYTSIVYMTELSNIKGSLIYVILRYEIVSTLFYKLNNKIWHVILTSKNSVIRDLVH